MGTDAELWKISLTPRGYRLRTVLRCRFRSLFCWPMLSCSMVTHRPCVTICCRWSEWTHSSRQGRCVHSLRWLTIQDLELNLWPEQHSQQRAHRLSLGK